MRNKYLPKSVPTELKGFSIKGKLLGCFVRIETIVCLTEVTRLDVKLWQTTLHSLVPLLCYCKQQVLVLPNNAGVHLITLNREFYLFGTSINVIRRANSISAQLFEFTTTNMNDLIGKYSFILLTRTLILVILILTMKGE